MAQLNDPLPFWIANGRAGADAAEIARAEDYVGHRLPLAFQNLLAIQNGGVSNYSLFRSGDSYYPMLPVLGADPDAAAGTLMRAFDIRCAFGVPEGVVPFAGLGSSWWGLDYRGSEDAPTVVFRQDLEHEVEQVASSFEELLGGLVEELL